jgi:hypothetical protein
MLFALSLLSVFGIYNTFTTDLIDIINRIPDNTEKIANYAIIVLFVGVMGTLQGINLKKKDLFAKMGVIAGIVFAIVAILAIILFFTKSLLYPLMSLVIIGITMYMLELVFMTIGAKGFFFFLTLFGLGIVALYKTGHKDFDFLVTVSELGLALLLFLAATYPRIKSLLFRIGTRDNIDIDNGGDDSADE